MWIITQYSSSAAGGVCRGEPPPHTHTRTHTCTPANLKHAGQWALRTRVEDHCSRGSHRLSHRTVILTSVTMKGSTMLCFSQGHCNSVLPSYSSPTHIHILRALTEYPLFHPFQKVHIYFRIPDRFLMYTV